MKARILPLLLGLSLLLASAANADLLDEALDAANLGPADLAFPLLPTGRDSLRLERVEAVLREGLRIDAWADSLCLRLAEVDHMADLDRLLAGELQRAGRPASPIAAIRLPEGGATTWRGWQRRLGKLAKRRFLDEAACRGLEEDLRGLLEEDESTPDLNVFELDSLERLGRRASEARKTRIESARLPDAAALAEALGEIDRLFLDLGFLNSAIALREPFEHPRWGLVHYADEHLAIGAAGPNRWIGPLPPVVVDMGGDDRYEGEVAVTRGGLSLVIDLDGDDEYRCAGDGAAFSVGGLAVLLDLKGNDRYRVDGFGEGASLGGVALLVDQAGDDVYEGDVFCQGAGSLGIGALVDGDGSDLYSAATFAQGFGHLAGFGLLQETAGHDSYLLRPRYLDQIRYEDHFTTLGQGFGFGQRPDLSGGIGLLHDLSGNDIYSCDIYGQGAGYWWSLGALVDREGNDRYLGFQYAQGAGVHLAGGLLLDGAGLDVYVSRGVSQGCGHDLAVGLLADRGGDDSYLSWDLSQGGGNANGTGLLVDGAGSDLYAMRSETKPRAWGDRRRRTGSVGLFVDGGGEDFYLGGGADDSFWFAGRRGQGLDLGDSLRREMALGQPGAPDSEEERDRDLPMPFDPLFSRSDRVERLYVWAIRLEPRWARERDAAREELTARGEEFRDFLRREHVLESKTSWERHALNALLKAQGAAAWPLLAETVADGPTSARGMALWTLSEWQEPVLVDSLFAWWERPGLLDGPGQRATVLEIFARAGTGREALLEGLDDPAPAVRRSAAWGLGQLGPDEAARRELLRRLGDEALAVREAARAALLGDGELTGERIEAEIAALAESEARREGELLDLLVEKDPGAAERQLVRLRQQPGREVRAAWLAGRLGGGPAPR